MSDNDTFLTDRWVRVMCDYCAGGLWDQDGCARDPDELPITADLKAMLRGWQAWYEHGALQDPGQPAFDAFAHSDFGLFIARMLKRELPSWTVVYFDAGQMSDGWKIYPALGRFEFEVTA